MTYDENDLRTRLEETLLYTPDYRSRQQVINKIIASVAVLEDERVAAEEDYIDQEKLKAQLKGEDLKPIDFTAPNQDANVADIIANHVRELEEAP